jgi:hypothetical protein
MALMEGLAIKETLAYKDLREYRDLRGQQDLRGLQGKGPAVAKTALGTNQPILSPALRVYKDRQVHRDYRDFRVLLALLAVAASVPADVLLSRVPRETPGLEELKVVKGCRDLQERTDAMVQPAIPARAGPQGLRGFKESRGSRDRQAPRAVEVRSVRLALPVLPSLSISGPTSLRDADRFSWPPTIPPYSKTSRLSQIPAIFCACCSKNARRLTSSVSWSATCCARQLTRMSSGSTPKTLMCIAVTVSWTEMRQLMAGLVVITCTRVYVGFTYSLSDSLWLIMILCLLCLRKGNEHDEHLLVLVTRLIARAHSFSLTIQQHDVLFHWHSYVVSSHHIRRNATLFNTSGRLAS